MQPSIVCEKEEEKRKMMEKEGTWRLEEGRRRRRNWRRTGQTGQPVCVCELRSNCVPALQRKEGKGT